MNVQAWDPAYMNFKQGLNQYLRFVRGVRSQQREAYMKLVRADDAKAREDYERATAWLKAQSDAADY